MACAELLPAYQRHLAVERALSEHTVAAYLRDVGRLWQLMGAPPDEPADAGRLAQLHPHQLRRYLAQLHAQGIGPRSLARILSAWRDLFRFLAREGLMTHNPCLGIRPPKAGKLLPAVLSPDETARLLDLPEDTWQAVRDRALFELCYSSGLRLAELASVAWRDVQGDVDELRVLGKGRKERIVPIGKMAREAITAWLALRPAVARADEPALFVNQRGGALGHRTIQQRLRDWAIRQGLSQGVHPHMLRHACATHVLQSSGDLRAVQELLGHASIASTQIYTHLDFQHLAQVYDQAHPRARRKS